MFEARSSKSEGLRENRLELRIYDPKVSQARASIFNKGTDSRPARGDVLKLRAICSLKTAQRNNYCQ